MTDNHYPTVDYDFLKNMLDNCAEVQASVTVGSTTAYLFKGERSISKRTITLRKPIDGQVDYLFATGIAHRGKCMGVLLNWFVTERNWKDGGYITA